MEQNAASEPDLELGQENVVFKSDPKSEHGHGWEDPYPLTEPLLPVVQPDHSHVLKQTGPPFRSIDGTIRNLPRNLAERMGVDKDQMEKLKRGKPAHVLEYMGELDRMLGNICLHQEQANTHHQIGSNMTRGMMLMTVLNLLFNGVLCYMDVFHGYPTKPMIHMNVVWTVLELLVRMWERYAHSKRAPGAFCFKFDYENLPALKELVGEQKWKDMQECSDHIRVLRDLNDIVYITY
ncbi:hypothetical protein KC19_2G207900 [Ceratodon purpureus]|uniref:Uncharacterized protein n=1 Tax=Ceratodon purpureus TaxID=3225 RepID=A0A8T0IYD6_CERPU|nr:hypothetical protein KC19_2G207900 [Ceratodon purpureus]